MRVVTSSIPLPWKSFTFERYQIFPGERESIAFEAHILWLCNKPSVGEYLGDGGRVVKFLKPEGAITVTPAGIVPTLRSTEDLDFSMLSFEPTFLSQVALELGKPALKPIFQAGFQDHHLRVLMTLLQQEIDSGAPSGLLYAESLAHAIAVRLLMRTRGGSLSFDEGSDSRLTKKTFEQVLDRIEFDLGSNLSLQSLAEEVGYSRGHFIGLFRATTGVTPYQYLISRRIERVKALLKTTHHNLTNIATTCGFSSQAHMAQIFRAKTGMTPSEFRRL